MLDKVAPKSYTWRSSDQTDSGSESHPLLSSDTSRHSFGATGCMFPDSETSDFEAAPSREPPSPAPRSNKPLQMPVSRRPFQYQNHEQLSDATYNRFHYYSKLRSFAPYEDPALVIPSHIISAPLFIPFFPGREQDSGKQSSLVTIFAIWNTIMGSSLLTMPWGVERAGFFTSMLLMMLIGGVCLYTTYLLLVVQRTHGNGNIEGEVADLCRMLLGRTAEVIAKVFSLIVLLGANVVYWILMSNFLYHSVQYIYDKSTSRYVDEYLLSENQSATVLCPRNEVFNNTTEDQTAVESSFYKIWDLYQTVPIFLIIIMGPLVNFKSATFFTKFNSLGTLSVLFLLIFIIVKSVGWGINVDFVDENSPLYVPVFLPSFPALSGMLALSFFIHNIIITIMRNNRHQENNGRDLSIAYVLVTLTYAFIGSVFYISFPLSKSCIDDNLLNNFQNSDVMTVIARIFLFFQLVTVFPLIAYMLRIQVFTILSKSIHPSYSHVLILNTFLIAICVIFAICLPRIGTIIRFTGALSGFVYIFTLPVILHLASLKTQRQLTWSSIFFHIVIPIAGGINLLAQFFVVEH